MRRDLRARAQLLRQHVLLRLRHVSPGRCGWRVRLGWQRRAGRHLSKLIGLFLGNPLTAPAKLQALLIAAGVVLILCMGLLIYGGYWHIQALQGRVELVAAKAQVGVLSEGLSTC